MLALLSSNTIWHRIKNFKAILEEPFDEFHKTCLYNLKFHVPDHVVEDLARSGCLELLDSLAYKHLKVHIKRECCLTLQRCTYALEKTISAVYINTRHKGKELPKARLSMTSTATEKLARVYANGPFLVKNCSKRRVHYLKRPLQNVHIPKSAGEVAANLCTLLETNITRTFVSPLRYASREHCSQPQQDI